MHCCLFLNIRSRGAKISKFENWLFFFADLMQDKKVLTTNWTINRGDASTNYVCQLGIIDCSQYIIILVLLEQWSPLYVIAAIFFLIAMFRSRTKLIFAHILSQNVTKEEELQRGPDGGGGGGDLLSLIPVTLSRYSISLKVVIMLSLQEAA